MLDFYRRFELGVPVAEKDLEKHKKDLGIESEFDDVDFFVFEKWWNDGYGGRAATRREMLSNLSVKMREEYLPHIRKLFKDADKDKVMTVRGSPSPTIITPLRGTT